MADLLGTAWPLPVFGLGFGIVALIWAYWSAKRFDRKWGN